MPDDRHRSSLLLAHQACVSVGKVAGTSPALAFVIVLGLVAVESPAQAPAEMPAAPARGKDLSVEIVVTKPGERTPRLDASGKAVEAAHALRDHTLAWLVGKERCATTHQLELAMHGHFLDKDNWGKGATGELVRPAVRLSVGPRAYCNDVVKVIESSFAAGFTEVVFAGEWREQPILLPRGVVQPVTEGGKVVVPCCIFNEPDDRPDDEWRPEIVVGQDGCIRADGQVVFVPGKDRDLARLRKVVVGWETKANELGEVLLKEISGSDNKIARTWVLLRADKWAEWRQVQAVLLECIKGDILFHRFHLAVADKELEVSPGRDPEKGK